MVLRSLELNLGLWNMGMTHSTSIKVFFEPKAERHDPDLYAHVGEAIGMKPGATVV